MEGFLSRAYVNELEAVLSQLIASPVAVNQERQTREKPELSLFAIDKERL